MMSVDIEKLRALAEATTQGRWTWEDDSRFGPGVATLYAGRGEFHGLNLFGRIERDGNGDANLDFVCAAHEAMLPLCDRVERAEAEVERLRAENARLSTLVRERDEAWSFLRRTAMTGGSIVSSAAMTAWQIAIARAADRMLVMPDGYGFVYVPGPTA